MTHDMVHRTHLRVFRFYYPPVLSDWWMDDWITHVYGGGHTKQGPHEVTHHTNHQGTRYEVNRAHGSRLRQELVAGGKSIKDWVAANVDCKPSKDQAGGFASLEWCTQMRKQHKVLVGVSWGSLPKAQQKEWSERKCNTIEDPLGVASMDCAIKTV